jgi:hypothetical protein
VWTMEAPNGRGLAVFKLRAVKAAVAAMCARSDFSWSFQLSRNGEEEATPMPEINMGRIKIASRK